MSMCIFLIAISTPRTSCGSIISRKGFPLASQPAASELHLPVEVHASSMHLQTHNPLSKVSIQLYALSQRRCLDTDRKLGAVTRRRRRRRPDKPSKQKHMFVLSTYTLVHLYYMKKKYNSTKMI